MNDDRFPAVVIRASAGTGKTFQLSNRFLELAAAGVPLDTILATTFTRKAAGEILDRVLVRLAEAALDDAKRADLVRHVRNPALDRARCLAVLHELLRHLHRLRVATLDSFFLRIAQSFSLELGLPPGWRIIDEADDKRWRAEAAAEVLAGRNTRDVLALMHLLSKGQAARSVSQQISDLVAQLYSLFIEAPAQAWQSLHRQATLSEEQLTAAIDALAAVSLPADKRFAKARDENAESARDGDWDAFVAKGLAKKVIGGETEFYRKEIPAAAIEALEPLVRQARAVLLNQVVAQTEATHQLLTHFDEAYQRLKVSRRGLRFDDVTRRLCDARIEDRLEQIAFRLDAGVAHLLLDEFQDTSPQQWRVLRPLAQRAVADAHGSLFCVGDVKQAIYGWRGGAAEIFDALDANLPGLAAESLNQSWRSCQVVIDTVGQVFTNIGSNPALSRDECPAAAARWQRRFERHTTALTKLSGHARLSVAPQAGEGEEQNAVTLTFAAEQIAALHREMPGATIGVLVRRNAAVARLIFELRHRDIEASEEGGNPLTDSPAVQAVLSLLRIADHPGDTVARYHVATSPLGAVVGLTRYDDAAIAGRLSREIRQALATDGYAATLYGWVQRLAPACNVRDLSRLVQLVELAYSYQPDRDNPRLRTDEFVTLVEGRRVESPTSARVRVMTVHQAKGLQFDIVVLPELDVRLGGQPPPIIAGRPSPGEPWDCVCRYVPSEIQPLLPRRLADLCGQQTARVIEESLCVLYVALTRAVHALHLIIAPARESEKNLPATLSGVLRGALAPDAKPQPLAILYEHGDAEWGRGITHGAPSVGLTVVDEPLTVRLAPSRKQHRGWEHRSPSQLEGGPKIDLARHLRLDQSGAMARGTLMHAWFQQIGWLDDGPPDEAVLREIAGRPEFRGLDSMALLADFRRTLTAPAVAQALCKANYQQPDMTAPQLRLLRERPFALRDGDAILSGTFDRLVVRYEGAEPRAADVLDFKSDSIRDDDPTAIQVRTEFYRPQLEAYRRAAAMLFGLDPSQVSARLIFTGPGVVVTL